MENKPICEIDKYGTKRWFINGIRHREDGPAVEFLDGENHWYFNGKVHRLNGPALELFNGIKIWYINGFHVTDEITQWAKDNDIDLDNLAEEDKTLIKIVWGDHGK